MLHLALASLLVPAVAGDLELYRSTLDRVDGRYLWPARIDHAAMFQAAAHQAETTIDGLLVDPGKDRVAIRVPAKRARRVVRMGADLPRALAALEDAIAGTGVALPADRDLRVELLRGALSTLDRHTVVLHAAALDRFDERLEGTLTGIGVSLRVVDRRLRVTEVFPSGPAAVAGLRTGDEILSVDGVNTLGMRTQDASERIRGAAGTRVHLEVVRDGASLGLDVTRAELSIPNVTGTVGPEGVGVVAIDHFSEQTESYLHGALRSLETEGALQHGVIVDLRGNSGGSLVQSARAADAFVQAGTIVRTAGREGRKAPGLVQQIDASVDVPPWTAPVVVLVDAESASGSEILAGALAQLGAAILVGEPTYGKGTVQSIFQVGKDVKLKLTVAEYVLAGERRVAGIGLDPDVEIRPVSFGENGAWYPDPLDGPSPPVPAIEVPIPSPGAPAIDPAVGDDPALAVAAALVRAAGGPGRAGLLAGAPAVTAAAPPSSAAVIAAMAAMGVDWREGVSPVGGARDVELELQFEQPPTSGVPVRATVRATNRGPELFRAAVRVRAVDPSLDDVLFVLGHLPSGGTRTGWARLLPSAGEPSRSERVSLVLEAAGIAPAPMGEAQVEVRGALPPPVRVQAKLVPGDGGTRVSVEVTQLGELPVDGGRVYLLYPGKDGLQLAEPADATLQLQPGIPSSAELGLRASETYSDPTYPLTLVLDAGGRRQELPLALPRDGSTIAVQPPIVELREPPLRSRPGWLDLGVSVTDDGAVDHVTVFAGGLRAERLGGESRVTWDEDKVAWLPGGRARAAFDARVPVEPGANRYLVVATDDAGLVTTRELYVDGGPSPAVADLAPTGR